MSLSDEFCSSWRNALKPFFNSYADFIIIVGINGRRTLVYLPYLNYSNLYLEQIPQLLESIRKSNYGYYNIRVLDFNDSNFKDDDPVTMRLQLNSNPKLVWENNLNTKVRNQIRKAWKAKVFIKTGNNQALFDDFFYLYRKTMNFYGSPFIPKRIIESIANNIESSFYVAYFERLPVASIMVAYDNNLVWVPWGASDRKYRSLCANNLVYWHAIEDACGAGKKIFDFGRSPFGGNTYSFKKQWGAYPIKINIVKTKDYDIYVRYRVASRLWKYLPKCATNFIGPNIAKHLSDL